MPLQHVFTKPVIYPVPSDSRDQKPSLSKMAVDLIRAVQEEPDKNRDGIKREGVGEVEHCRIVASNGHYRAMTTVFQAEGLEVAIEGNSLSLRKGRAQELESHYHRVMELISGS